MSSRLLESSPNLVDVSRWFPIFVCKFRKTKGVRAVQADQLHRKRGRKSDLAGTCVYHHLVFLINSNCLPFQLADLLDSILRQYRQRRPDFSTAIVSSFSVLSGPHPLTRWETAGRGIDRSIARQTR
jgi:hypothetical protein